VMLSGGDVRRIHGTWRVVAYVDEQLSRRFDAAAAATAAGAATAATTAPAASAAGAAATPTALLAAAARLPSPAFAIPPVSAAVVACAAASSRRGAGGAPSAVSMAAGVFDARPAGRPMLLAVSRALGDLAFKTPQRVVSCVPHVHTRLLDDRDRFLVLASDGLWDVLSDADAVQLASDALQLARPGSGTPPAQQAADALIARARKRGTSDNTTVLVVVL
jgi:hypothetical protein